MTIEQPATPLFEGWGDWVDPRSYLNDVSGFGYAGLDGRVSVASDRASGDNPPFWSSEQEHAEIRGICRFLAQIDEVGVSSLQTLTNYVVGWGSEINWQARNPESREIVRLARSIWEHVCDAEGLSGMWEREAFTRLRRDGERCVWVHADGGEILVDFVEPEFITQPGDSRTIEEFYALDAYDWRYGVATTLDRPHRWHGLYASFFGSATDWEWLPKRDVVWSRINVDSSIKRGVSDLYPTFRRMEQASKLMTNTLQGASIQAAIAYIREHAPGTTASGIASVRGNDDTRTIPTPNGGRDVRIRKITPGQIVDVSNGLKYTAGPVGSGQGSGFLQLVQAAMRLVGIRWSMPEYLISGDASNGNYASTLVAEAPFTKAAEAMQSLEAQSRRELIWKVLDQACRLGRLRRVGIESVDDLRLAMDLEVTYPPVAVRNRLEDAQVAEVEKRNGVLSARTWAEDAGRDYEEELRRGAAEAMPTLGAAAPVSESVMREAKPKKYDHIDFTPPEGVRSEAAKGLEWRKEHGRGGTAVGVARARDLSNGVEISPETAKRMYSYFARHEVDKEGEGWKPSQDGFPSAGRVAWALWGGDAGEAWASKLVKQMAAADDDDAVSESVDTIYEALAKCWRKYP